MRSCAWAIGAVTKYPESKTFWWHLIDTAVLALADKHRLANMMMR